jgi:hypothetical protein
MSARQTVPHAVPSSGLADILERVLDKGMVITGDIKIKLVDIELLTIQIRLIICSVERAREMGMDWWTTNPEFNNPTLQAERSKEMEQLHDRVRHLETQLAGTSST